jgi:hypothetical protein
MAVDLDGLEPSSVIRNDLGQVIAITAAGDVLENVNYQPKEYYSPPPIDHSGGNPLLFTDLNDATILATAITRKGEAVDVNGNSVSALDISFAVGGAAIPFVSGAVIKSIANNIKYLVARLQDANHSAKFSGGASKLISTEQLKHAEATFNSSTYGPPNASFVAPADEITELLSSGRSRAEVADALGIEDKLFLEGDLIRVNVLPEGFQNLGKPTGLETGANSLFQKGGKTKGGVTEGVLDNLNYNDEFIETVIYKKK